MSNGWTASGGERTERYDDDDESTKDMTLLYGWPSLPTSLAGSRIGHRQGRQAGRSVGAWLVGSMLLCLYLSCFLGDDPSCLALALAMALADASPFTLLGLCSFRRQRFLVFQTALLQRKLAGWCLRWLSFGVVLVSSSLVGVGDVWAGSMKSSGCSLAIAFQCLADTTATQ